MRNLFMTSLPPGAVVAALRAAARWAHE